MEFWKMNGAGNDFIILDNREYKLTPEELGRLAAALCPRRFAVGADGFMAVEEATQGGDFKMRFYNADGTMGEMCGNGARCICRYGYERGLAGEIQRVETTAGLVIGQRLGRDSYRVRLNDPSILDDRAAARGMTGYVELGDPGVPHCLYEVTGLEGKTLEELRSLGYDLRHDPAYPKGANANLFGFLGPDHLVIRTFERGVEDFTYACGTGTGSLVSWLTARGRVSGKGVRVENLGGTLTVDLTWDGTKITDVYLTGPAALVYKGRVDDSALGL